jgi:hypothetical protein
MKLDLHKKHKAEYVAPRSPALVTAASAKYLAIAGRGDPAGPAFQAAVGALYGVAFTIKMAKKRARRDYAVAKLEGLWWGGQRGKLLIDSPPSTWRWKLLIRVPAFVTSRDLYQARAALAERGRVGQTRQVKLEALYEGRAVQVLHVGPYDREHASIRRMEEFARSRKLRFHGRHHEIYLSDPRRVPAARLRTILRHPVRLR